MSLSLSMLCTLWWLFCGVAPLVALAFLFVHVHCVLCPALHLASLHCMCRLCIIASASLCFSVLLSNLTITHFVTASFHFVLLHKLHPSSTLIVCAAKLDRRSGPQEIKMINEFIMIHEWSCMMGNSQWWIQWDHHEWSWTLMISLLITMILDVHCNSLQFIIILIYLINYCSQLFIQDHHEPSWIMSDHWFQFCGAKLLTLTFLSVIKF